MIKVIEQGAYMSRVDKMENGLYLVESSFLGSRYECSVSFHVDGWKMETVKAFYSVHRTPQNDNLIESEIPELVGQTCTFSANKIIKTLPEYDGIGMIKELLLENLRCVNQAEMYMLEELGIEGGPLEYEKKWLGEKKDYCRPYTGRMPGLYDWPVYVNSLNHFRTKNLYNKYRQYTMITSDGINVTMNGTYQDSFHEMHAQIEYVRSTGEITDYDMTMVRWPFTACYEMDHQAADQFIGKNIHELTKRDIGGSIGGSHGCFHLVDIVADLAKAARDLHEVESKK